MYMNEVQLLENKEMRETYMERLEVLDQVGSLLLLDGLNMATTEMVAKYYGEDIKTVERQKERNFDEFESDGYKVFNKESISNLLTNGMLVKTKRGGFDVLDENENVLFSGSNKGVALWTKRAILRLGMLLRDSKVAKELRTQLLNIVEVVKETNDGMLVQEIDKEKQLYMNIMFAKTETERAIAINEHLQYVERYKQKAERYDKVYEAPKLFTITQIAKDLGMSGQKLNKTLNEKGVIYKGSDNVWHLYSKYQHLCPDYCDYHVTEYGQTLKWKNKGREWIIDLLK